MSLCCLAATAVLGCTVGVDHPYGDLPLMPLTLPLPQNDTTACNALCEADPECEGWVIQPGCGTEANTMCWKKQQWMPPVNKACRCSQIRSTPVPARPPPANSGNAAITPADSTALLNNGLLEAQFSTSARGVQSLRLLGPQSSQVSNVSLSDGFLLGLGSEAISAWDATTTVSGPFQTSSSIVSFVFSSGPCLSVNVTYEAREGWRFLTKQLFLALQPGCTVAGTPADLVASVAVFDRVSVATATLGLASWAAPHQFTGDLAAFLRLGSCTSGASSGSSALDRKLAPSSSKAASLNPTSAVSGTGVAFALQGPVTYSRVEPTAAAANCTSGQELVRVSLRYDPLLNMSQNQGSIGFPGAIGAGPAGGTPLFASDRGVISVFALSRLQYAYPLPHNTGSPTAGSLAGTASGVNTAERDLMRHAADAFFIARHSQGASAPSSHAGAAQKTFDEWREGVLSGKASVRPLRATSTASTPEWYIGTVPRPDWVFSEGATSVNVAWTENDYEIDAAAEWAEPPTANSTGEYHRIIMRNGNWTVDRVLYAPHNPRLSSPTDATDSWGWEEALWMTYGEQLRNGSWYPTVQPPAELDWSVSRPAAFAAGHASPAMPYIYPNLAFAVNSSWWHAAGSRQEASIGDDGFQAWFIDTISQFTALAGTQGAGFDYTFTNDNTRSFYQQWAGWRRVLATLRSTIPNFVMDNRQLNHEWGAWMWVAGSYAEPLMTDENAQTWGGQSLLGDPRTDRMSANRVRHMNLLYANELFAPVSAMPGFAFHQTDRSLNNDPTRFVDHIVRDFDWVGHRYSLLSSIAHAPLNTVVCQNGARDSEEFELLPRLDGGFVRRWLQWADANIDLASTAAPLSAVVLVNETSSDSGLPSRVRVDGSYMLLNGSGLIFLFNPAPNTSLTPQQLRLDDHLGIQCNPGGQDSFNVSQLYPAVDASVIAVLPCGGSLAGIAIPGRSARVWSVQRTATAPFPVVRSIPIAGAAAASGFPQVIPGDATFSGGNLTGSVTVPAEVWSTITAVQAAYPVNWTSFDLMASWLGVNRVWLFVDVGHLDPGAVPSVVLTVNGASCPVSQNFNAAHGRQFNTFNGWAADLVQCGVTSETPTASVALSVPTCPVGSFHGVFVDAPLPENGLIAA